MIDPKAFAAAVLSAVKRELFGIDEVIRLCLVAFYSGGHVLLEANPGLGKTELVKTLGRVLKLPFRRIQFTPDLMPADITGTYMPDVRVGGSAWTFHEGPIFTSLLLADEINRATPKTQSAMLEAMAEQQVTVLGERKPLPSPFAVLATQNPIDQEGTYNLPEAQADRFLFKVPVPSPDGQTLREIMQKRAGVGLPEPAPAAARDERPLLPSDRDESRAIYGALQSCIRETPALPALEQHIVNMLLASNEQYDELKDLDAGARREVRALRGLLTYGLGPRAAIALMLGAKAWMAFFGPAGTSHAGGPALAHVVIPALRHRVKLDLDWEERYCEMRRERDGQERGRYERLLRDFCLATAPPAPDGYKKTVEDELKTVMAEWRW